jgi:hypothetical protein
MIMMKTIVSALFALTVLASVTAPASAEFFYGDRPFDSRSFFEYLQNHSG